MRAFFQQDEWFTFGSIISGSLTTKSTFLDFFRPEIRHFNPLTDLLNILQFNLFKLKYEYWAATSILLNIVASVLVFKLAQKVFKKTNLAFITALLFGLSAAGSQGTTWVVAATATQGAAIFGILSLIFIIDSRFAFSLMSLFISLLFKETTFATFLLLPLMLNMFSIGIPKQRRVLAGVILGLGLSYTLLRALPLLSSTPSFSEVGKTSFLNFFTLPVGSLAQSVVPVEMFVTGSERISRFFPPVLRGEKRSVVVLSTMVFVVLSSIFFLVYKKLKEQNLKNGLIFGYLFVILNSFIILLSPERAGTISIVDSRNLYYVSVGTSLIVTSLIGYFLQRQKIFFGIFLVICILATNSFYLQKRIKALIDIGQTRREILTEIKSRYADLPQRAAFYTQSDTSYYGLPVTEKILPFQSGFGYTLLVWYDSDENFPKEFFAKDFLWDITSQGYREIGDRGFGYFRDRALIPRGIDVLTYLWEDR